MENGLPFSMIYSRPDAFRLLPSSGALTCIYIFTRFHDRCKWLQDYSCTDFSISIFGELVTFVFEISQLDFRCSQA